MTIELVCDWCKETFTPKRPPRPTDRFCCREHKKAWWDVYNLTHVHSCWHCGKSHDPEEPAFLDVLEMMLKGDDLMLVDMLLELVARRRGSMASAEVVPDDPDVA